MTADAPPPDVVPQTLVQDLLDQRGQHCAGLSIRRRAAQATVADGSRLAVHVATEALDLTTGRVLSWREAPLVEGDPPATTASCVPVERIRALRRGRALR